MGTLPSSKILPEPQQKPPHPPTATKGGIGRICDGVTRGTGVRVSIRTMREGRGGENLPQFPTASPSPWLCCQGQYLIEGGQQP